MVEIHKQKNYLQIEVTFKKIILVLALLLLSIQTNAQFNGGFGYGDPSAWFDKEIYFSCQNNCVYYGQGLNFSDVFLEVKGVPYIMSGVWNYGDYIFIGKNSGINLSTGDEVKLYIGVGGHYYYIATWICPKQPTMHLKMKGVGKLGKYGWGKVKKTKWDKILKMIKYGIKFI